MNVVSMEDSLYFLDNQMSSHITQNMDGSLLIGRKAQILKDIIPFLNSSSLNEWLRMCLEEESDTYIGIIEQFKQLIMEHSGKEEFNLFFPDDIFNQMDIDKLATDIYPLSSLIECACNFRKNSKGISSYQFTFAEGTYFVVKRKIKDYIYPVTVYISAENNEQKSPLKMLEKILEVTPEEKILLKDFTLYSFLNCDFSQGNTQKRNAPIIIKSSNEERFKSFRAKAKMQWQKNLYDILSNKWTEYSYAERLDLNGLLSRLNRKKEQEQLLEFIFTKYITGGQRRLKVGVISPFTYGKSTFINSLIQVPLLQEDILVKTAAITRIIHYDTYILSNYESSNMLLEKMDNFELFRQQISGLTTQIDNQSISAVRAMLPHEGLVKNIELVDTPGLFGPYPLHDQMTERFIEQLDVIIYMLDPLKVGFEPYTKKINELQDKYRKKCVFVMNKIDQVPKESDRKLLVNELREKVIYNFKDAPLFLVSSYFASRARFFKKGLIQFDELKRDHYIYAKENDEIVSGRSLNETHIESIEALSGISDFEQYLLQL